jgi:cytochrome c oxidase subunit 2
VKTFPSITARVGGIMCYKSQQMNDRSPARGARAGARQLLGVSLVAVGASLTVLAPHAGADDAARGRQLYQLCAACHGPAGQGNQRYAAPAIAGLDRWYLEAQLTKFKAGARGFRAEDGEGLQMRPMARALGSEQDVKAVAAYVASLAPVSPPPTVAGDAERGRTTYVTCGACHGDRGQGNAALAAPPLARQADWYLVAQLRKFRQGLRGTHPHDTTGAQMRPLALTLPDDRALADVVAYIRTLAR